MTRQLRFKTWGWALGLLCSSAFADPPVLPPNPPDVPPAVFCFMLTGASHSGSGVQIQFEVLNWTKVDVTDLTVTIAGPGGLSTGGTFAATPAVNAGPAGNGNPRINDWTVDSSGATTVRWVAGTPLPNIDLHPGGVPGSGSGAWLTPGQLPSPLGSGPNTLDGFRLDLPGFAVGTRIVLDWSFSVDSGAGHTAVKPEDSNLGFDRGIFQIDRASDGGAGEVRFVTFFNVGSNSSAIGPNPPALDLAATNANPGIYSPPALVPEPASVALMAAGLAVLAGLVQRRQSSLG